MRVVVHHPARTEPDGTAVEPSVAAFRLGRIDDFVNPITGETTPADEVAAALLAAAKAEHPDLEVSIERLVCNEDGTEEDPRGSSRWVHHEQVPEGALSPEGTVVAAHVLAVDQTQEAS